MRTWGFYGGVWRAFALLANAHLGCHWSRRRTPIVGLMNLARRSASSPLQ